MTTAPSGIRSVSKSPFSTNIVICSLSSGSQVAVVTFFAPTLIKLHK